MPLAPQSAPATAVAPLTRTVAPAQSPFLPGPAPATATPSRPAADRVSVLAAFQAAARPQAAGAAAALPVPFAAPPAPAPAPAPPPLSIAPATHVSPAPIARFRSDAPVPAARDGAKPQEAPKPLDLDAVADHVLERLRSELRDGRERLGFLLDDSH